VTTRLRRLGLDELMIVNPETPRREALFLGDDDVLYRIEASDADGERERATIEGDSDPGRFFLGDDGTVYEIVG
jgi:hypothetical protein